MNKDQFVNIMRNPDEAGMDALVNLEELIREYPYFQAARVLHLKLLKDRDSIHFRRNLKTTSAYATDRTKLFHYINGGDLKQMQEVVQSAEEAYDGRSQAAATGDETAEIVEQEIPDKAEQADVSSDSSAELAHEQSDEQKDKPSEVKEQKPGETEKKSIQQTSIPEPTGLSPQQILEKRLKEIREGGEENPEPVKNDVEEEMMDDEPLADSGIDREAENLSQDIDKEMEDLSVHPEKEQHVIENMSENLDTGDEIGQTHRAEENYLGLEFEEEEEGLMSFVHWLRRMNSIPGALDPGIIRRVEAPPLKRQVGEKKAVQGSESEIIDHFIKSNPRIERKKAEFYSAQDMARRSVEDRQEMVSETLANIYADQGFADKAIVVFEKLILKYPQKSAYFAARIQSIKDSGSIK